MVLLIAGIFFGLIGILSIGSLGWFALIWLVAAVLFIAGGIGNLVNGRPDPPTPAELQKAREELARKTRADPQSTARLEELRRKQGG